MIGIQDIGVYIPSKKQNNLSLAKKFGIDTDFISDKIGIEATSRRSDDELASDLCVKAFDALCEQRSVIKEDIDCIVVCTQNGDYILPHTSAIVHAKLDLPKSCAVFDISLGCSGYVYSLHVMKSFMQENQFKKGLLFTSDPYSNILDENDKNTSLLFGDAATATLLTDKPTFNIEAGVFESYGKGYQALIKRPDEKLYMNGREIFNFVLGNIPGLIEKTLEKNNVQQETVDYFLFHQASKYVIDKLIQRLQCNKEKTPFSISGYGNTVSSSVPILLKEYGLANSKTNTVLLCGFGVGLSMASTIIRRVSCGR